MAHHPIVFSDTTNKNGLLQECEFWTNLGDGTITGDATMKKVFTSRLNEALDRLTPFLYSFSNFLKWDDANQDDYPVGTFNIVSGQSDYVIKRDDNDLDILNITNVRVLPSAVATLYSELEEMTMDDPRATTAMSPNTVDIGIPTHFLKYGNAIFLYPQPNYSATAGAKIYFEREASYFDSSDTIKETGIPRPCQGLLPLYASYDWLLVNKPANGELITRLEAQIAKREGVLKDIINTRNPHRGIMRPAGIQFK